MAPACNPAFTLPRDSGAPAYIHKQTLALRHAELGTHSVDSRELWGGTPPRHVPQGVTEDRRRGAGGPASRRRVRGQRAPPNVGQSLDEPLSPLTRGALGVHPASASWRPDTIPACLLPARPRNRGVTDSSPSPSVSSSARTHMGSAASREAQVISVRRPLSWHKPGPTPALHPTACSLPGEGNELTHLTADFILRTSDNMREAAPTTTLGTTV